jgi:hypothetical protein
VVIRARLAAPPPQPQQEWPWHKLKYASLPSSVLLVHDRRMEAETYLSSGFGVRVAIESKRFGWTRLATLANVHQPARLKGVLVSPEYGTPFLAATQVFDIRPVPRKFLAIGKMENAEDCFVQDGMILVTRSGSVGRVALAYAPHRGVVVSDDLLRITARSSDDSGWLYAYLHTPQARAMMTGVQYGHIIKHLETTHLEALPVPLIDENTTSDFGRRVSRILALRNEAHRLGEEALACFGGAVGPLKPSHPDEGYEARAHEMTVRRRRLDASYHAPRPAAILRQFKRYDRLGVVVKRVWWMTRFKRYYGDDGIPYLSANELFTLNPPENKRVLVDPADDYRNYFVRRGWIVVACSGQVYGLNGAAVLITEHHENIFFSHDLIRIIPDSSKIRPGYLLVALTHPTHGRPLLIRSAYGTSIPHLDPVDVADFPVVRLDDAEEMAIADLAESSAKARAEADVLERDVARDAAAVIDRFLASST